MKKITRRFETTGQVFDALGVGGVMALTRGNKTAVYYYKASGKFPPKTYVVLKAALSAIGADAPDSLWQMIEPDPVALAGVVQRLPSAAGDEVQP
ncbi:MULTISPECIES: hypothetical protein [unclassified Bradyrhizobium]|uniref:hypothetical protein n=1 Tax=unclassified Bradyrhizobium TaxID=2631580 RepID=UPI00291672BB|nr:MULTISPECIES: hypothetical protein [unclassified Bradyrhizobium]